MESLNVIDNAVDEEEDDDMNSESNRKRLDKEIGSSRHHDFTIYPCGEWSRAIVKHSYSIFRG